jgi:protein-tyrosine phosphatase
MRSLVAGAGLEGQIVVESAGTAAYHIGELPDRRSREAAKTRNLTLTSRARQFARADWDRLDYVVAMDRQNYEHLAASAPNAAARAKLRLLRAFDPDAPADAEVPDPFHGGADGFEEVLDLCEAACEGLLAHIRREHRL